MGWRALAPLAGLVLHAGALPAAQTSRLIVVDAALGPGAHFASIGAALQAAADGDVVLVRPASYAESVVIADKALVLVGAPGRTRPEVLGLAVRRTPAGGQVSVRGLDVRLSSSLAPVVEQCAGKVWLEDVRITSDPAWLTSGMEIVDSEAVVLVRCTLEATRVSAVPGLRIVRSGVQVFASHVTGADSNDVLFSHGEPGGTGLWVEDARAFLSGSSITGGAGGDVRSPICALRGGNGGTALFVLGTSRVDRQDGILTGGPGGTSCGEDGQVGAALVLEGGIVRDVPGAARACRLEPVGELGRSTTATLTGRPGDLAMLLCSPRAAVASASPLFRGRLLLGVPLHLVFSAFVPESGELRVPLALPRTLGTRAPALHAQGLFLDPGVGLVLSAPSSLALLGAHTLRSDPP